MEPFDRDANLLRILRVRPQESNPHALQLLITHCTAPIVILGRLCIQKITDPHLYGLTVTLYEIVQFMKSGAEWIAK